MLSNHLAFFQKIKPSVALIYDFLHHGGKSLRELYLLAAKFNIKPINVVNAITRLSAEGLITHIQDFYYLRITSYPEYASIRSINPISPIPDKNAEIAQQFAKIGIDHTIFYGQAPTCMFCRTYIPILTENPDFQVNGIPALNFCSKCNAKVWIDYSMTVPAEKKMVEIRILHNYSPIQHLVLQINPYSDQFDELLLHFHPIEPLFHLMFAL